MAFLGEKGGSLALQACGPTTLPPATCVHSYLIAHLPTFVSLKKFFKRLILEIQRGEGGEREREKERERGRGNMDFVAPPIHAFTGCSLCVPRLGSEPTALVNQDDALSN